MAVQKESRELLSGGVGEGRAVCRGVGRRLFPTPKSGRGVLSEDLTERTGSADNCRLGESGTSFRGQSGQG